jgi:hypothetical protein
MVIETVSGAEGDAAGDADGEAFGAAAPPLLDPHAAVAASSTATRTCVERRIATPRGRFCAQEHGSAGLPPYRKWRDR